TATKSPPAITTSGDLPASRWLIRCYDARAFQLPIINKGGDMKFIVLSLGLAVSLSLAGNALAQVKPEDAIKYRKSVYAVMGWNFGPLAAMA
ncbi:MAG: hypothetical protein ACKVQA_03660, partial [Burkholderiales bacterium]